MRSDPPTASRALGKPRLGLAAAPALRWHLAAFRGPFPSLSAAGGLVRFLFLEPGQRALALGFCSLVPWPDAVPPLPASSPPASWPLARVPSRETWGGVGPAAPSSPPLRPQARGTACPAPRRPWSWCGAGLLEEGGCEAGAQSGAAGRRSERKGGVLPSRPQAWPALHTFGARKPPCADSQGSSQMGDVPSPFPVAVRVRAEAGGLVCAPSISQWLESGVSACRAAAGVQHGCPPPRPFRVTFHLSRVRCVRT